MTDIELTILRHLYINPIEGNFTKSVLTNSLSFDENVLESNLRLLITNNYVETVYTENQRVENNPCYRITGFGAKKINELDGKGIKAVIAKYGVIISFVIGIIGAVGVAAKIYYDRRTDERGEKQLYIQCKQLQVQQQMLKQKIQGSIILQDIKSIKIDSCFCP